MSDEEKPKKSPQWRRFGTEDDLRKLRGYSRDTAVKPRPPKRKKPKLRVVKGGKK